MWRFEMHWWAWLTIAVLVLVAVRSPHGMGFAVQGTWHAAWTVAGGVGQMFADLSHMG